MQVTPEIDAILNELCELCYEAISGEQPFDVDRAGQLVKSLAANGWQRHQEHDAPLGSLLKDRVRDTYLEQAMHRGAELEGLAHEIQQMFNNATRYQTRTPHSS